MFDPKPYSEEKHGNLLDYLREHEGSGAGALNLFRDSRHFFTMKEMGLFIPLFTTLRVDNSPAPDIGYFVNNEFLLESNGRGHYNMSWMGAEKGVYDPSNVLENVLWSVYGLNPKMLYLS